MKFEKVNDNKIKITINYADLAANNIDYNSFMSGSAKTRSLFLSVLDKAERDYGFSTDNYSLRVETVALEDGDFILTITRSPATEVTTTPKKKVKVSRKSQVISSESLIYKFNNFEDLCNFVHFIYTNTKIDPSKAAKNNSLFLYKDTYYLVFERINAKFPHLKVLYSTITEFGTYVKFSDALVAKMNESGKVIANKNAINVIKKYFI